MVFHIQNRLFGACFRFPKQQLAFAQNNYLIDQQLKMKLNSEVSTGRLQTGHTFAYADNKSIVCVSASC